MLSALDKLCVASEQWQNRSSATLTNSTAEYKDTSVETIYFSLQVNGFLMLGQLIFFWVMLRCKPHLVAPNFEGTLPCRWSPLGWAYKVWHETRMSQGKSARHIAKTLKNLDGAVMVRFCILGFKYSFIGSLFSCFLLPWFKYAVPPDSWAAVTLGFNRYNIMSLQGDNELAREKFWPVILSAYVLVAFFIHFSIEEWENFEQMRKDHFTMLASGELDELRPGAAQAQRSLLVELVPEGDTRRQDGRGVFEFFHGLFPGSGVHSCVLQAETGALHQRPGAMLTAAGRNTIKSLQVVLRPQLQRGQQVRHDIIEGKVGIGGLTTAVTNSLAISAGHKGSAASSSQASHADRADMMDGFNQVASGALTNVRNVAGGVMARVEQVTNFAQDVAFSRAGGLEDAYGSSTAFVTFNSVSDRVVAEQIVLCYQKGWVVRCAPEANDVVWANAAVSYNKIWLRTILARAILGSAWCVWLIPVAAIQALTQIDRYHIPYTDRLPEGAKRRTLLLFVSSYLPVLAQMGLLYLLPVLFVQLAQRFEGHKVKSEIQLLTVSRYIAYQFITVYVTVTSSTLMTSMCRIINEPEDIFTILQEQVPTAACYFITYVMARAGLSAPMLLLFSMLSCPGEDGQTIIRPMYAMEAANLCLVFMLGLTYGVIAPAIMPCCMLYFGLTALIYCWLFMYVYTPEFNCKGGMWYDLFNSSIIALEVGCLALAGITQVYVDPASPEFSAALILCVIVFIAHGAIHRWYSLPSQFTSLEAARYVDEHTQNNVENTFQDDYYIDPVIKELRAVPVGADSAESSATIVQKGAGRCCCCCRRDHELVSASDSEEEEDGSEESDDETRP